MGPNWLDVLLTIWTNRLKTLLTHLRLFSLSLAAEQTLVGRSWRGYSDSLCFDGFSGIVYFLHRYDLFGHFLEGVYSFSCWFLRLRSVDLLNHLIDRQWILIRLLFSASFLVIVGLGTELGRNLLSLALFFEGVDVVDSQRSDKTIHGWGHWTLLF